MKFLYSNCPNRGYVSFIINTYLFLVNELSNGNPFLKLGETVLKIAPTIVDLCKIITCSLYSVDMLTNFCGRYSLLFYWSNNMKDLQKVYQWIILVKQFLFSSDLFVRCTTFTHHILLLLTIKSPRFNIEILKVIWDISSILSRIFW